MVYFAVVVIWMYSNTWNSLPFIMDEDSTYSLKSRIYGSRTESDLNTYVYIDFDQENRE